MKLRCIWLILLLVAVGVEAMETDIEFDTPAQAELYERLTNEVRCLVCQNQTIGDSNAPLAADLRRELREQVAAGHSEAEIKVFLTDRYGDFVLYKPRFDGPALLLWLAPFVLLLIAIGMLLRSVRRRATLPVPDETTGREAEAE